MRRFIFNPDQRQGSQVILDAGESRHIARVLRLQPGTRVELFDGQGKVYGAVLEQTDGVVRARLLDEGRKSNADRSRQLLVGQAVLQAKKMDTVIQKCTELGVDHFAPFWSSRCQGKLTVERNNKRHERCLKIIESACKQCGRPQLMELSATRSFAEIVNSHPDAEGEVVRILFWEGEQDVTLHDLNPAQLTSCRQVVMLLGPEGGFSEEEVVLAQQAGWRTVSLGRNILRAETATLAAVAIVQFLTDNL